MFKFFSIFFKTEEEILPKQQDMFGDKDIKKEIDNKESLSNGLFQFVKDLEIHKKISSTAISTLYEICVIVENIEKKDISIEKKIKLKNQMIYDLPKLINDYMEIPKAHAVSFILPNGKTSKQILIDTLIEIKQNLEKELETIATDKSNDFLKTVQSINTVNNPKENKDFFDF